MTTPFRRSLTIPLMLLAALSDPEIRERALAAGAEPFTNTPQEFAAMIREETRKWAQVIRTAGIKLQ